MLSSKLSLRLSITIFALVGNLTLICCMCYMLCMFQQKGIRIQIFTLKHSLINIVYTRLWINFNTTTFMFLSVSTIYQKNPKTTDGYTSGFLKSHVLGVCICYLSRF